MVVTASKYVNARTPSGIGEKPSLQWNNSAGYLSPGQTCDIADVVVGQEYRGSAIWYQGKDGQCYWSGGFENISFIVDTVDFNSLSNDEKMLVLKECVQALYDYYKKMIGVAFTGLGVSFKKKGEAYLPSLCLAIQVESKNDNAPFQVSPISYKGFLIPTDVEKASVAEAISQGSSMNRCRRTNRGTLGFYYPQNNPRYLITNYHVVADDLLQMRPPQKILQLPFDSKQFPVSVPFMNNAVTGSFVNGRLDWLVDMAVVKLNEPGAPNQYTNDFMLFSELESLFNGFGPGGMSVQLRGGISQDQPTVVMGLYCKVDVTYFKQKPAHSLYGLIKLQKVTQPGDSGSPVKHNQKLIGLVVAEDSDFTYAIPIENILTTLKSLIQ